MSTYAAEALLPGNDLNYEWGGFHLLENGRVDTEALDQILASPAYGVTPDTRETIVDLCIY